VPKVAPCHATLAAAMIDAGDTLALLEAIEPGVEGRDLEALVRRPELARMFPAVGISTRRGLGYLRAAGSPTACTGLGEAGRQVVEYFGELRSRSAEFRALAADMAAQESAIVADAWSRTATLLPDSQRPPGLRFVFLPIGLDFRTERETVYMDPLAALGLGPEGIRATLAHELHHVGRYRLTGENLTLMSPEPALPPGDIRAVFREWATWLEAEGIADCVSNITETAAPILHRVAEMRRQQMRDFDQLLPPLLARIRRASRRTEPARADLRRLRRDLRWLAHPLGARIAGAVLSSSGRPALIECVGQPKLLLQRYNDVAGGGRPARFDPETILWLDP
jgi:Putative zinc dependent peptidase (DUF5700)